MKSNVKRCRLISISVAKEHSQKIYDAKLANVPDADRKATQAAIETATNKQTEEQQRLLKLYPMVKTVDFISGFLVEYDNPTYRKFEQETNKINELRATKPASMLLMATREQPKIIPTSAVFYRGNPESPKHAVEPAEISVLNRHGREAQIATNNEQLPSTGRRLAYARQLTDGTHPLTARVFANRVWMHYFGKGLVETPGDFGISGEKPTHPKLLDWLADEFVRSGWDHKRLHRLILTSRTYRQSSARNEVSEKVDPENFYVSRMKLKRLDAESIRDAILTAAGHRNDELRGPSLPVTENTEGKVVIGKPTIRDGLKTGVDNSNAHLTRRSIFVQVRRQLQLNMMATFDQPQMNPNCEVRRPTTVATQSLWFLNDDSIVQQANAVAKDVVRRAADDDEIIHRLFKRIYFATPASNELQACRKFLRDQTLHFEAELAGEKEDKPKARLQAVSALTQTLFASNRFLYVD